jgi:hypothetical protein
MDSSTVVDLFATFSVRGGPAEAFTYSCRSCGESGYFPADPPGITPAVQHVCGKGFARALSEDECEALLNTMAIWCRGNPYPRWSQLWSGLDRASDSTPLGAMLMSIPGAWAGLAFGSWGGRAVVDIPRRWWSLRGSPWWEDE